MVRRTLWLQCVAIFNIASRGFRQLLPPLWNQPSPIGQPCELPRVLSQIPHWATNPSVGFFGLAFSKGTVSMNGRTHAVSRVEQT